MLFIFKIWAWPKIWNEIIFGIICVIVMMFSCDTKWQMSSLIIHLQSIILAYYILHCQIICYMWEYMMWSTLPYYSVLHVRWSVYVRVCQQISHFSWWKLVFVAFVSLCGSLVFVGILSRNVNLGQIVSWNAKQTFFVTIRSFVFTWGSYINDAPTENT